MQKKMDKRNWDLQPMYFASDGRTYVKLGH